MKTKVTTLAFIAFFVTIFVFVGHTQADTSPTPNLLQSPSLSLDKIRDLASNELDPYSINGNRDCTLQKVTTRPAKLVPLQTAQSHDSCVVDTAYGAYSTSGYLQRQGTSVAGQIRTPGGNLIDVIPIPRSSTSMKFSSTAISGVYLYFTKNFISGLKSYAIYTGEVNHTSPPEYTSAMKDKAGNRLYAKTDSLAFSANGEWMIVDTSFIGMVRVNLETFEVLPFGDAIDYNIGLTPSIQSAISGDGRYAVVFSKTFRRFIIYDLNTCASVPTTITGKVSCQSRDLYPFMPGPSPSPDGVGTIRFINNNALSFYSRHTTNGVRNTSQYVLRTPESQIFDMDYLALGDSYTSGEGAYNYKALTDTSNNKCHLSLSSYPYLLGSDLNLNKYESVACSGAKIYDIKTTDKNYKGQVKDGIKRQDRNVDQLLYDFNPGYLAQQEFTEHYKPAAITISAIGNDIGFASKLMRCLEPDTCFSTYEDRLEIVREINSQFNKLTDMYSQIKAGDPRTKIYAIGYPQIAAITGSCAANVHLNTTEIEFTQGLITYLNSMVKQAAVKVGIAYVDVENALNGFRLCEPDSTWDVAVNGLTAGNDTIAKLGGPFGNESYHPTAFGQQLIAAKIRQQTTDFTVAMPDPNPSAASPTEDPNMPFLQVPHSNRQLQKVNYDSETKNDVMYRNGVWNTVITGLDLSLKPLSTFKLLLQSDPIDLGTSVADVNGDLSLSFVVPPSAPIGYHTLHIQGLNAINEPIDIYKTVYVAENQSDFNGDGVSNLQDPCPSNLAVNLDNDQDGVDDACDGFIDQPPPAPIEVLPPIPPEEPPIVEIIIENPPEAPPIEVLPPIPPEEAPIVEIIIENPPEALPITEAVGEPPSEEPPVVIPEVPPLQDAAVPIQNAEPPADPPEETLLQTATTEELQNTPIDPQSDTPPPIELIVESLQIEKPPQTQLTTAVTAASVLPPQNTDASSSGYVLGAASDNNFASSTAILDHKETLAQKSEIEQTGKATKKISKINYALFVIGAFSLISLFVVNRKRSWQR